MEECDAGPAPPARVGSGAALPRPRGACRRPRPARWQSPAPASGGPRAPQGPPCQGGPWGAGSSARSTRVRTGPTPGTFCSRGSGVSVWASWPVARAKSRTGCGLATTTAWPTGGLLPNLRGRRQPGIQLSQPRDVMGHPSHRTLTGDGHIQVLLRHINSHKKLRLGQGIVLRYPGHRLCSGPALPGALGARILDLGNCTGSGKTRASRAQGAPRL